MLPRTRILRRCSRRPGCAIAYGGGRACALIHGVSESCHEVLLSTIAQTAMRGPFGVCRHTDCPSSKLRPRARHVQFGSAWAAKSNAPTAANIANITAPARRFRS